MTTTRPYQPFTAKLPKNIPIGVCDKTTIALSAIPDLVVYNPIGPHLPPPADKLAEDYHRELQERFGLVFNDLWTITNMPIQRWRDDLSRRGELNAYMIKLADAFNPDTVNELMCRH